MRKKHDHPGGPEIQCEKCGGEIKVLNAVYPNTFECACKTCNHKFLWVSTQEK